MKCGLLGRKLGHSYSPQIHARLGDYEYLLFEKEPEELDSFLHSGSFTGINVTIPYKKAVIPFLDSLTPRAQALGAVNTIVRKPDGTLEGHNTDFFGFETMLASSGVSVSGKKVLVCGSGGAANTACAVLKEAGSEVVVLSRSGENNYHTLSRHADAALIVNATPVGMYPNVDDSVIDDLTQFPNLEAVLDLTYNPARTAILLKAEKMGLPAVNGLKMLVAQAKESAEWFTGEKLDDSVIDSIYRELHCRMENIVLIGMPGCGKSTIGKLLAKSLNRPFVDADSVLEETYGRPITSIIPEDGEEAFRDMECQVLHDLGKQSGLVIATGGGCVTHPENYVNLHRNGRIFWLRRDTALLPTAGRPLSKPGKLEEMLAIRGPLYERFADRIIDNHGAPELAAHRILEEYK